MPRTIGPYTIGPFAILRRADLSGADLRGTNLRGAILRGATLPGDWRHLITDPDEPYAYIARPTATGWRILAGCHDFTLDEAIAHWSAPGYRRPDLGAALVAAIRALPPLARRRTES